MRVQPVRVVMAAWAVSILSVAACSSSGGNSSAEDSGTTSGGHTPVTVTMISQITASNFQAPETVGAAKAVVASINADGGLGGHPIKLIICNDKEDPTTAGNCARSAAQASSVAVVEGISLQGTTILPVLQAAQIPAVLSPTVPADFSNPYSFPKDGGTVALYGGEGVLLAEHGCKKVAVLYDSTNPVGPQGGLQVKDGVLATGGGATVSAFIGVPETTTDLTPVIDQADSSGADCIGNAMTITQTTAALQAVAQSAKPHITFGAIGPAFPPPVASQLGNLAKYVILDNPEYLPSDPRAEPFTSVMTAGGVTNQSAFAANVYVGFKLLQAALKGHTGPLTAADVKTALQAAPLSVPTVPGTFDFSHPYPNASFARITNLDTITYQFNGKTFIPLSGAIGQINAKPALDLYSK